MEWPELGGEGLARVEVVREGGSEQLLRYRPSESRPELDTRLSSSSARCSVVSFSSWISLGRRKKTSAGWRGEKSQIPSGQKVCRGEGGVTQNREVT